MTPRVCLVGPVYPFRGGIAHYTTVLAQEFAKDHEVQVVNFKRLYPSLLFPGKTQFDESGNPFTVESVRLIDSINPISFWQTARAIAAFKPDAVFFQWWQPFFAVAYGTTVLFLKRSSSARIVFLCHNVLPHESSPVDRILIKLGLRGVRHFLVHSEEDRRNLLTLNTDAVVSLHPLPVMDAFKQGRYDRQAAKRELGLSGRIILFFGYIRRYKGLDVLIEAFAESVQRLDSTLLIVGEFYESKQAYIDMIRKLGIEAKVVLVDRYVPNEDVEKFFVASDVVVLPYRSATQSAIVQVAYSFDRPVIVTSVGGLPDVVEDGLTGFVVPRDDPQKLCGAICKFFDEERGKRMEGDIARAKRRFSWQAYKETLVGLGGMG
ncbi:MAG: glycosyltransferase [Candidatus Krumholzibacteria bacterium]|nr:glycosyltransferase [Candidatus Krumholzibacteria bacterium]